METLKACMILSVRAIDMKMIRQALVAFTLMERYLIHFEDNFRQIYEQAAKQVRRDELAAEGKLPGRKESPLKVPQQLVKGVASSSKKELSSGAGNVGT